MSNEDDFSNPLSRKKPLGGRTGVAIVSIVPFIALILFLIFGFAMNGWAWSWIFFIAIPIAGILVYGLVGRQPQ
jgi:hypothetical protein